jgi:hypothetical protein
LESHGVVIWKACRARAQLGPMGGDLGEA